MSPAFVTQPTTFYRGQTDFIFRNSGRRCNNDALFHTESGSLSLHYQSLKRDGASQALSFEKQKRIGRESRFKRLPIGTHVVAPATVGDGSADSNIKSHLKAPMHGNEKKASRRLQVVSNATPVAVGSATGLLIPLPTVDSDHGNHEGVDTNLFNQMLIQKKVVPLKRTEGNRVVETEEEEEEEEEEQEIAIVEKNLQSFENSTAATAFLLFSSAAKYESMLVDFLDQLEGIRLHALALEQRYATQLEKIHRHYYASERNLLHYMGFRSLDVANLQEGLASSGLSGLEGCEAHTLASLNTLGTILFSLLTNSQNNCSCLDGETRRRCIPSVSIPEWQSVVQNKGTSATDVVLNGTEHISYEAGNFMLSKHAEALLGSSPPERNTVIMVTLPSEAAEDDKLIRHLLLSGMNVARINCAHDSPEVWKKMVQKVRFFAELLEMPCRVSFDLTRPKLRTGPMQPGPSVLKIKPTKDSLGHVVAPACVWIAEEGVRPSGQRIPDVCVPIIPSPGWTKKIQSGDAIKFKDARGRSRELRVMEKGSDPSRAGIFAECRAVSYIEPGCALTVLGYDGQRLNLNVGQLPEVEQAILLRPGDKLLLKRDHVLGSPAQVDKAGKVVVPASVTCTLDKVFDVAKLGQPVKFDDGKIGGVIGSVSPSEICVTITEAGGHKGRKLKGEKAINFPESDLSLNGLTVKDAEDLDFVVANADMLALSFVNGPADVRALQDELARRGADEIGIVVKIETELGFQSLPSILLQTMVTMNPVGVMVARGDMAVECGWQRLAEIQDQILLLCEAAHVPTIWATQVLEELAKSGLPSRAEITDAASGSRAECVMLNKGPYILQAVASLDDILRREASRRRKNRWRMHPLQNLGNLDM